VNDKDENGKPRVQYGPITWLSNNLIISIKDAVTRSIGREWKIKAQKDLSEFAYHRCAVVSDGSFGVFFKYSEAPDANRQFEIELSDIQFLSKKGGRLVREMMALCRMTAYRRKTSNLDNHNRRAWNLKAFMALG